MRLFASRKKAMWKLQPCFCRRLKYGTGVPGLAGTAGSVAGSESVAQLIPLERSERNFWLGLVARFWEGIRNSAMCFSSTRPHAPSWRVIRTTDAPLADIAAQCGFADQARMTRNVTSLTSRCPSAWHLVCK
jgi:hypothetical protein